MSPSRFYRQAYGAVTDFTFYRKIFTQPLTLTLTFLLYLSAHAALISTAASGYHDLPELLKIMRWAQVNFPLLEIKNNQLTLAAEQPLVKKHFGPRIYTFVFDTTGGHLPVEQWNPPAVLFTRDQLYVVYEGGAQSWRWPTQLEIGQKEIAELEQLVRWAYYPIYYATAFLSGLLFKTIQALFLTFFATSAVLRQGVRLPFKDCFTISLYALTPAVVIDLALMITGQTVPYFVLIYLATAVIYTYLAAQRCVVIE